MELNGVPHVLLGIMDYFAKPANQELIRLRCLMLIAFNAKICLMKLKEMLITLNMDGQTHCAHINAMKD